MKTNTAVPDSTSQSFLTGAILFANLDYSAFSDYAVKATIGGAIWMIFKLAGDYLSYRILSRKKNREEDNQSSKSQN